MSFVQRISWQVSSPCTPSSLSEAPVMDYIENISFDGSDEEIYKISQIDDYGIVKKKHKHYLLFQKRFNKCVLDINFMNYLDKLKLKYIS